MNMLRYMQPFSTDDTPNVLFTGNGLHRAFQNEDWDKLLRDLSDGRFTDEEWGHLKNLPYPQLAIVATGNHLKDGMERAAELYIDSPVLAGEDSLIRQAVDVGFDAILTTNYSYEIEKALYPDFRITKGSASKYRKITCKDKRLPGAAALYYYQLVPYKDEEIAIWHIHGEAARSKTMVIGHYYYGRLLSRVKAYTEEAIKRYRVAEQNGKPFYPRSWVDYVLFGNVYIVGQGMDFSEMDLWWLMDYKKLYCKGKAVLYKPDMSMEQTLLAKACDVQPKTCKTPPSFAEYYRETFREIEEEMTVSKKSFSFQT